MSTQAEHPILLFDGVCNLCSGFVQWVLPRDKKGRYRFASLQSELGKTVKTEQGLDPDKINSIVLYQQGKVYTKSAAALRLAVGLGGWYQLAGVFFIIPPFIRDAVYDFIARNRYRWFGKSEACWLPRPEWKERFLA